MRKFLSGTINSFFFFRHARISLLVEGFWKLLHFGFISLNKFQVFITKSINSPSLSKLLYNTTEINVKLNKGEGGPGTY